MAKLPQFPLLRFDVPEAGERRPRKGFAVPRRLSAETQQTSPAGQRLTRLAQSFAEGRDPLELRADPAGLAPERLLVFDLTGDVQNFARAAARVPGLEVVAAEDLDADEEDKNPSLYLLVPDAVALGQLVQLWNRYQAQETLPEGFAPWRDLFSQLRDLRPWGPQDRVSVEDVIVLSEQHADPRGMVRLELELVYRANGDVVEADAVEALRLSGGELVSRSRIDGPKYHALLVDVPEAELYRILDRGYHGLVAAESVMHIRPQSAVHFTLFEAQPSEAGAPADYPTGEPIAAVFDAVPLAGHPHLAERLSVDDPFALEELAVGRRVHGTAMASAVVNGDLAGAPLPTLTRRIYFLNVMFAPQDLDQEERFPDRLPADLFHEAVLRMKSGADATAPSVVVVNSSLGDRNKPFSGRMSGWARVIDYLAHRFGLLFVISAGNHLEPLSTADMDTIAFEALDDAQRVRTALLASAAEQAHRRVLSPAESMNALTIGALHTDSIAPAALPASTFDVWQGTGLCTVSSALGPGIGGATKPDVLAAGGRHHVRLLPDGAAGHLLRPIGKNSGFFGGILVASPPGPTDQTPNTTSRTIGTSVAAALTTGLAARSHEALEAVYDDFLNIPNAQRAVLLKALLVHCARWTSAAGLIVETLGPADRRQNVRQKDNVRRYLGFGAVEPSLVLDCATDRATLWATGTLSSDQAHTFSVPLPGIMSGLPRLHEVSATVAWFAPPRVGVGSYRAIRLRLLEPTDAMTLFAVKAPGDQPDANQTHRGTVIHRRWSGAKAAALGANSKFELVLQRQPDDLDD